MKTNVYPIVPPPSRNRKPVPAWARWYLAAFASLLVIGIVCIIAGLSSRRVPTIDVGQAPLVFRASRISSRFDGGITNSGEVYDSRAYVCAVKASLGYKWGDIVVAQSVDDAGPRITVARVIDLLPESAPTDIDLSGPAFLALAPHARGIVRVWIRKP